MLGKVNYKLVLLLIIFASLMTFVVAEGFTVSGSSASGSSASGSSASGSSASATPSQLLSRVFGTASPSYDTDALMKAIQPILKTTIHDELAALGSSPRDLANKNAVLSGSSGSLKMDTLPNPAQAPTQPSNCSPAAAQGADYTAGCKPFNIDEYIRKDSIPCYGCTLPA